MKGDIRCFKGSLWCRNPQNDDPDLETWVGDCPLCDGLGCDEIERRVSRAKVVGDEVDRIMAMSDDDILAETRAQGLDPETVAAECRVIFERAIAQVEAGPAHRVVQSTVINWANGLQGKPSGKDISELIAQLTQCVLDDRVRRSPAPIPQQGQTND